MCLTSVFRHLVQYEAGFHAYVRHQWGGGGGGLKKNEGVPGDKVKLFCFFSQKGGGWGGGGRGGAK